MHPEVKRLQQVLLQHFSYSLTHKAPLQQV
jgi:hypothetical protein